MKSRLQKAIQDFIDFINLEGFLLQAFQAIAKYFGQQSAIETAKAWQNIITGFKDFNFTKSRPIPPGENGPIVSYLLGSIATIISGIPLLNELGRLAHIDLIKQVNRDNPSSVFSISDWVNIYFKERVKSARYEDDLLVQGWSKERIEVLKSVLYQLPNLGDIVTLVNRQQMSQAEGENILVKAGYRSEDAKRLVSLRNIIPPVTDLIRMAVREAFSPEIINRFGLLAGFPSEILPFTKSQGLDDEWVKKYWVAHWQLPSLSQGYEMFHRLRPGKSGPTFTITDLDLLMKAQDVPEYFRDKLREIAYNPVTRVDIRRLYRNGVWNEKQVLDAYLDVGYSPDNAKHLTNFTIIDATEEQRSLTKANILNAYRQGRANKGETINSLKGLNYGDYEANFLVNEIDFKLAEDERKANIDYISELYLNGKLSDSELAGRLGQQNLTGAEQNTIVLRLKRQKERQLKPVSKGDIETWYEQGLISQDDFYSELIDLGYVHKDADRIVKSFNIKLSDKWEKEKERALKETQRLYNAEIKNDYQIRTAEIDLALAQSKQKIYDLKLVIDGAPDGTNLSNYYQELGAYEKVIYELNVSKANLKVEYLGGIEVL